MITFTAIIKYTGPGTPNRELSEVIEGLCGQPLSVSLRRLPDESVRQAARRYVRQEFVKAAKGTCYEFDTKPFTFAVEFSDAPGYA